MALIPIFGALIPICFSIPFSLVLDSFPNVRALKLFFIFGPSCTAVYWITLIWIKIIN